MTFTDPAWDPFDPMYDPPLAGPLCFAWWQLRCGYCPQRAVAWVEWKTIGRPKGAPMCQSHLDERSVPDNFGALPTVEPFGPCAHHSCRLIAVDHACPREAFLDDPITVSYGVGSEMVGLVACHICDLLEVGG